MSRRLMVLLASGTTRSLIVYYLHFGTVSFAVSPALALAADSAAPFLPLTPKTTREGANQHLSAPLCLAQVVVGLTSADGWDLPSLCKLAAQDVVSQLTVESVRRYSATNQCAQSERLTRLPV